MTHTVGTTGRVLHPMASESAIARTIPWIRRTEGVPGLLRGAHSARETRNFRHESMVRTRTLTTTVRRTSLLHPTETHHLRFESWRPQGRNFDLYRIESKQACRYERGELTASRCSPRRSEWCLLESGEKPQRPTFSWRWSSDAGYAPTANELPLRKGSGDPPVSPRAGVVAVGRFGIDAATDCRRPRDPRRSSDVRFQLYINGDNVDYMFLGRRVREGDFWPSG